jgi:hypothetical protein
VSFPFSGRFGSRDIHVDRLPPAGVRATRDMHTFPLLGTRVYPEPVKTIVIAFLAMGVAAFAADYPAEIRELHAAAQNRIDHATDTATVIMVEAVVSQDERRLIWQSDAPEELRALKSALHLKLPKLQLSTQNGKEVLGIRSTSCFCYGQLWVTLKAKDEVVLSFLVKHGTLIGSEELGPWDLEATPFAEFYGRMMKLANPPNTGSSGPQPPPASLRKSAR